MRIALLLLLLAGGCARVYTVRIGGGVERRLGENDAQIAVTFGFHGHITGKNYVGATGRLGATFGEDPDPVMSVGPEWLLALPHATVRLGAEFQRRMTLDGDAVYHALGARAAALFTFRSTGGRSEDGVLDKLGSGGSDPVPALFGVGSNQTQSSRPSFDVMRRQSVGIEASGGFIIGDFEGDRVGYLGLVYEYDVLRVD